MLRLTAAQHGEGLQSLCLKAGWYVLSVERPHLTAALCPSLDKALLSTVQARRDFGDFSALTEAFFCRGFIQSSCPGWNRVPRVGHVCQEWEVPQLWVG